MIDLKAVLNRQGFTQLADLKKRMPLAVAKALTFTADRARKELALEMPKVFDNPTKYTTAGFYIKPADPKDLTAFVKAKDKSTGGGTPATLYLYNQIEGVSARATKRFERKLTALGVLPAGWSTAPGKGAELDQHGNMPASFIRHLIKVVQSTRTAPAPRYGKNGKQLKAKVVKTGLSLIFSTPDSRAKSIRGGEKGGGLPYGIWNRTAEGKVVCLLFFLPKAKYRARFDADAVIKRVVDRDFERLLVKEMDKTINKKA